MKSFLKLLCIITIFLPFNSNARPSTLEDAPINNILYIQKIDINKDGTFEEEIEIENEILNDLGKNKAQNFYIYYNDYSEYLKILSAKTINDNKEYIVKDSNIEDKEYISGLNGFDAQKRIRITFPNIQIGSKIKFKYKRIAKVADLNNHYGDLFYLGSEGYQSNAKIYLTSELELYNKINDPKNVLQLKDFKKDNKYHLEISLKKPICNNVIGEEKFVTNPNYLTWVSVSTIKDWSDFGKQIYQNFYLAKEKQQLPKDFDTIIKVAGEMKTPQEKINTVTTLLNEKVYYMGDWRTVNGRFSPRDFKTIISDFKGDCKDYALITTLILRELGFNANVVLVWRGEALTAETLPYLGKYNHAMVKASKDGHVFWIDPTNYVSMSDGIFPDIADKEALLLSTDSKIEIIPNIDFKHNKILIKREFDLLENNYLKQKVKIDLFGESAISFTGMDNSYSKEEIEDTVLNNFSGYIPKEDRIKITLPSLKSKIVNNITFSYEIIRKKLLGISNSGPFFPLYPNFIYNLESVIGNEVGDLVFNHPSMIIDTMLIKNIKVQNLQNLDSEIKSPWFSISRKCNQVGNDVQILTHYEFYQSFINNKDLKSLKFKEVIESLNKNFYNIAITNLQKI